MRGGGGRRERLLLPLFCQQRRPLLELLAAQNCIVIVNATVVRCGKRSVSLQYDRGQCDTIIIKHAWEFISNLIFLNLKFISNVK